MATSYKRFGLSPSDVITDVAGNVIAGRTIQVWTAYTGGGQVTDLEDLNGSPLPGVVTTNALGRFPFLAPADRDVYWLDDGQNPRWAVSAIEALDQLETAVTQSANAATLAAHADANATDALIQLAQLPSSQVSPIGLFRVTDITYGAQGDGTTDDTAAIQAALDAAVAAGGGIVILPSGKTFKCNGTLRIGARTHLVAFGATIRSGVGMPLLFNYTDADLTSGLVTGYNGNGSQVTVEGGMWDMRGHVLTTADPHNCMTFAHARNITVRDVTIRNVRGFHAIEPHSVQTMLVDSCRFEGYVLDGAPFEREAVQIDSQGMAFDDSTPCKYVTVRNCYCGPSPVGGEGGVWGRFCGSHTAGTSPHEHIAVLDNDIDGTIGYGTNPYSWQDSIIARNRFKNTGSAAVYAQCAPGLVARRLQVIGNIINTVNNISGVHFLSPDSGATRYTNVAVQDNLINNTASNGIYLDSVNGAVVTGNRITTTVANYGIQVGGGNGIGAIGVLVANNLIDGAANYAIRLNFAQGCQIVDNKICGPGNGSVSITTSTRCIICGNDCTTKIDGITANGFNATTWCTLSGSCTINFAAAVAATGTGNSAGFSPYSGVPGTTGNNYVN